jgi:light-harvesting complex I chlorophyll a/b binding protein 1
MAMGKTKSWGQQLMRCINIIILYGIVAQAHIKEPVANHTGHAQDSMDKLLDKLVDNLVDRRLVSPIHHAYLDSTVLAKTHSGLSLGKQRAKAAGSLRPQGVRTIQHSLKMYGIPSSPVEKLAISAIDATNRGNQVRDISMRALDASVPSTLSEMLENVDETTKERFLKVEKEVMMRAENLAGITAPLGFFDPLGFSTDVSAGKLLFYREAELKHGRIAILASLGILVGEQYHPLFGNIEFPAYLAFQETSLQFFWPAALAAIAIPEMSSVFRYNRPGSMHFEGNYPHYLGYDPLNLKQLQTTELITGRLAMLVTAGMIARELATGEKIF